MKQSWFSWGIFLPCLAASFALAWLVQLISDFNYWAAWAIVAIAWAGAGVTTLVDDEDLPD